MKGALANVDVLKKDDHGGFQLVGNAIPIDPVPQNVAYLKEAIQKKMGVTGQLARGRWQSLGNGWVRRQVADGT